MPLNMQPSAVLSLRRGVFQEWGITFTLLDVPTSAVKRSPSFSLLPSPDHDGNLNDSISVFRFVY